MLRERLTSPRAVKVKPPRPSRATTRVRSFLLHYHVSNDPMSHARYWHPDVKLKGRQLSVVVPFFNETAQEV
jgi:hypothetical protein